MFITLHLYMLLNVQVHWVPKDASINIPLLNYSASSQPNRAFHFSWAYYCPLHLSSLPDDAYLKRRQIWQPMQEGASKDHWPKLASFLRMWCKHLSFCVLENLQITRSNILQLCPASSLEFHLLEKSGQELLQFKWPQLDQVT